MMGSYLDVWRCTGTEPYKNEKGNKAKCPFSHKGKLFPAPGPVWCGKCASKTEAVNQWFPENPAKDRVQLLRALVWYTEEIKGGFLRPVTLEVEPGVHQPLLEAQWRVPFANIGGIQYWLIGNLDSIKHMTDPERPDEGPVEVFIADYKTTKNQLGPHYWGGFNPNVQVNIYDLVGDAIMPAGLPYSGVAIEAIQVVKGGVRFAWKTFKASQDNKAELVRELQLYLTMARQFAQMDFWPKNRTACKFCQFKPVCTAPPSMRDAVLDTHYVKAPWNPLTRQSEPAATSGRIVAPEDDPNIGITEKSPSTESEAKNVVDEPRYESVPGQGESQEPPAAPLPRAGAVQHPPVADGA